MIIYPSAFILSSLSAGAGLHLPRICYATHTRDAGVIVTVSGETAAGPKDMPLEPSTNGYWQAPTLPATWEIDLGATRSVDYVGIAAHTIGSSAAGITVETSDGTLIGSPGALVWEELGGGVVPADDAPLLFLDDARDARMMRITLTGSADVPQIAVVYVGLALAMPRGPEMGFGPPSLSRTTELHSSMSRGGQFLGQAIKKYGVSTSVSFARLQQDWYRSDFDPFVKSARQFPYFFGWHPEAYPTEVAFVWTREDIRPSYSEWEHLGATWNMEGIGNE